MMILNPVVTVNPSLKIASGSAYLKIVTALP